MVLSGVGGGRFQLGSRARSFAVDSNGVVIVAALWDGRVVVRNIEDERRDETLRSLEGGAPIGATSAGGRVVAWTGARSLNWRVEGRASSGRHVFSSPRAVAVTRGGEYVAVGSVEAMAIVDVASGVVQALEVPGGVASLATFGGGFWIGGRSLFEWLPGDAAVREVGLAGDGPVSVAAGGKSRVAWRGQSATVWVGERVTPLGLPVSGTIAVAESGLSLGVCGPLGVSVRSTVRPEVETINLTGPALDAAAFTPDGGLVAVASTDAIVRFFDARTGKERTPGGPALFATAIAWHAGDLWVGDRSGAIARFDRSGRRLQLGQDVHRSQVTFLGSDQGQLLSTGVDGAVLAHDPEDLDGVVAPKALLERRSGGFRTGVASVYLAAQDEGRRYLALARGGGTLQVVDQVTGDLGAVRVPRAPLVLAISAEGRLVVVGPGDEVRIYEPGSDAHRTLSVCGACAVAVRGETLLVGGRDGLHRFSVLGALLGHTGLGSGVRSVAFFGEGAVAGLVDGRVVLVDLEGLGEVLLEASPGAAGAAAVLELAVDAGGGRVAARDASGRVTVSRCLP